MLAVFMEVAQSFLDSGFGAALIQKRDTTLTDTCTIFYFNILVGVAAAALLCLIAPWIAAFYSQPILTPLTWAMSLIIVINSLGLIQRTVLEKQINFKTQTKVGLIAGGLSGVIGIAMAIADCGVWSLVVQQISSSLFATVSLWYFSTWRPSLIFSFKSLQGMFNYSSRLLAAVLLNRLFENLYLLTIGKLFSAADLGFFTRAKTMVDLPAQTISGMVGRVTFPVFSSIHEDQERLKRGMRKVLTMLVLVNVPIMLGLAIVARPVVLVLLTGKWAECIPYVQLLCLVQLSFPFHLVNIHALQALGRTDLILRLEIIKKLLIVINIALAWRWGISAMILGMIATSIVAYYLNTYYIGRLIRYTIWEQLFDVYPCLVLSAMMGVVVYGIGLLPFPSSWSMALVQITLGGLLYACACWVFRLPAFMEMLQMCVESMKTSEFRDLRAREAKISAKGQ
jgi:O-antigen/teichoic acid export membrane protein